MFVDMADILTWEPIRGERLDLLFLPVEAIQSGLQREMLMRVQEFKMTILPCIHPFGRIIY